MPLLEQTNSSDSNDSVLSKKDKLHRFSRPNFESSLSYYSFTDNDKVCLSDYLESLRSSQNLHHANLHWLARFFAHQESDLSDSPFKAISSIPAKSIILEIEPNLQIENSPRYQALLDHQKWHLSDWVSEWRAVVSLAVKEATKDCTEVAVMLSSGIDSTGIAAHLTQIPGLKVKGFSWRFPNHPEADESETIATIADYLNIEVEFIDIHDAECFYDLNNWPMSPQAPYFNAMRRIKNALYQRVSEQDYKVLLNGHIGDELAYVDRYYYSELFRSNPMQGIAGLFQCLKDNGLAAKNNHAFRYFFKRLLKLRDKPLLMPHLTRVSKALLSKTSLDTPKGFRKEQFSMLLANSELDAMATESYYAAEFGIERRHPYLNEELISLALACPAYLLSSPQHTKLLARQALKGMLPEDIIWQERVGNLDSVFEQGLEDNQVEIREFLFHKNRQWPYFVKEKDVIHILDNRLWDKAAAVLVPCIGLERWLQVWDALELPLQLKSK